MNILEKEIEDLLFDGLTNHHETLKERGLHVRHESNYVRQFSLGNYGRPDIVGYSLNKKEHGFRRIDISIFELKKDIIDIGAIMQACRYQAGIERYLRRYLKNVAFDFNIYLVGKSIDDKSDFVYLLPSFYNITLFTYRLDFLTGLEFSEIISGYFLSNPQFPKHEYNFKAIREALNYKVTEAKEMEDLPF